MKAKGEVKILDFANKNSLPVKNSKIYYGPGNSTCHSCFIRQPIHYCESQKRVDGLDSTSPKRGNKISPLSNQMEAFTSCMIMQLLLLQ